MPNLRDLLRKKDKIEESQGPRDAPLAVPTLMRSTTELEEVIEPPSYPEDLRAGPRDIKEDKRTLGFRNSSNASFTKDPTAAPAAASDKLPVRERGERRLSQRLHLHRRDRSRSAESSSNLPDDLPAAPEVSVAQKGSVHEGTEEKEAQEQREAQWEKRATMLAMNPKNSLDNTSGQGHSRSRTPSISDSSGDVNILEAIRLHESGDLARSTDMFGKLANPQGANNALAQVLYGLALRHGWGIEVEPEKAIHYLSLAASNSATIEQQALASGMKKGGSMKGELVLATYELANCFRHGWGIKKDPIAARQYYETAANLGDTDAMEEVAWCYLEGFGGAKDKFKAAQYLRLAESKGAKKVGQSWIWKDKYNPK